ncbi:MAG: T9SS type A sorting domain-containing protein [Bacteroidota bacterium]
MGISHDPKLGWKDAKTLAATGFSSVQKIIGDAVYILNQGKVYASWDTAKTWKIDTINIGTQYVQDVTVDTNNYGWVITQSRNLYSQHPDSNIWRKDTSFKTTGFPQAIFVDRRGRMFISTTAAASRVWMSTDGGLHWNNTSTGITETIASFGDDLLGNVYAVGTGSQAYRLSNLTPPWISIGDSIAALAYLPSNSKIINSISGDSILYAATKYGMFQSTDSGATWKHSLNALQVPAHNFYTGVVKGGNYYFISTNLGIYRVASGDSTWKKVFPKQGFIWGVNVLTSDSAGNVYSNLPFKTGPSTSIFYTVKSTDHGDTWIPDTAGFAALGIKSGTQSFDFFVDKQGVQYLGGNARVYSKKNGKPWKIDTVGLGLKTDEYIADVSLNNKKGVTYIGRRAGSFPTYTFVMYQRADGDSVWHVINTSTLSTAEARLFSDPNGNVIVRTLSGSYKIWKYDGVNWKEIPLPTGLGTSPFAQKLTVDQSGVLWGSFFGSGINQGIFFSSNNGTNWNYTGLKKMGINFLSAVGDAVYVVTFIDGIFGFTTLSKPTSFSFQEPTRATLYELYQNYPNPFNPSTTIRYSIPASGFTTLKVYDVLGREVAVLFNEEQQEGFHSAQFDGSKLSTGVYIYTLKAGSYSTSKKLLLIK